MNDTAIHLTGEDGTILPATSTLPLSPPVRGGIVPLHPASDASRDQFLFRHLANLLPPLGVAVLRFDRRPDVDDKDIALEVQASDAFCAMRVLREQCQHQSDPGANGSLPIGLWGFSQGAWAAPLAASLSPDVAFLILVASTGVSPARQMRYGTVEQVRRAGFDQEAIDEVAMLRATYEDYLRGRRDRASAQAAVDRCARRPWFSLIYVPHELPPPGSWHDMDFDPAPIFSRVHCPVLLFYGEDDEWTPVDESADVWRRAVETSGNPDVTIVRLPGTSHHPTLHGGREISSISPLYTETLATWLRHHI